MNYAFFAFLCLLVLCGGCQKPPRRLRTTDIMLAGGIATATTDILLYPLDTIKVKQQSSRHPISSWDAFQSIANDHHDVVRSLFKGALSYSIIDGSGSAIFFAVYEFVKAVAATRISGSLLGLTVYPAAAVAFTFATFLLVPGELLKTRMQTGSFENFWECIADIVKPSNGGVAGLYTGYSAAWMRDMPYFALQLGFYDNIRTVLQSGLISSSLSLTSIDLFSSIASGILTGILTNPMDVVTARLMTQGIPSSSASSPSTSTDALSISPHGKTFVLNYESNAAAAAGAATCVPYLGVGDCVRRMMNEEGPRSFVAGTEVRLAWIAPFTVISLNTNEFLKRSMLRAHVTSGAGAVASPTGLLHHVAKCIINKRL